jgi:hypothetical protein
MLRRLKGLSVIRRENWLSLSNFTSSGKLTKYSATPATDPRSNGINDVGFSAPISVLTSSLTLPQWNEATTRSICTTKKIAA